MELTKKDPSMEQRVTEQLHLFSELSETLTLRLLELEERFAALERSQSSTEKISDQNFQDLMRLTEEKLRGAQSLLTLQGPGQSDTKELSKDIDTNVVSYIAPSDLTNQGEQSEETSNPELASPPLEPSLDEGIFEQQRSLDENGFVDTEYLDDPQMPLMSA